VSSVMAAPKSIREHGFSLVELSIVLVIVGILLGSSVAPLSQSIKQGKYKRTTMQLANIREAMHGYLVSSGRLPCPINLDQSVVLTEKVNTCSLKSGGIPAASLGIVGQQSKSGALLDEWGRAYRYTVSQADHPQFGNPGLPDWLTVGETAAVGASNLSAELQLCRAAASEKCSKKHLIANQIAWVVVSLGEQSEAQSLEVENMDNDHVFTVSGYSTNQEQPFDDQLIWASRSELVYWLLKANWLP